MYKWPGQNVFHDERSKDLFPVQLQGLCHSFMTGKKDISKQEHDTMHALDQTVRFLHFNMI